MKNYIILNGKSSETIQGLIIQSLPPISKPKIRTEIEEIDGRDGDIVTPLGYSAYDKQLSIGLSYNYDIDEIISYFNSSGTVTFSNEEDKYYNYQILEQIDFEKLLKFKTAVVTLHVQPFKYSNIEDEMIFNITNNLLSIPNFTQTTNGITLAASNGVIRISGTGTTATEFYLPINALSLSEGNYTLSALASGTGVTTSSIRLIGSTPTDTDSFGENYIGLQNDTTVTLNDSFTASKTFNYLWFYITPSVEMSYTLNVEVTTTDPGNSVEIRNNGNYISKPTVTITGSGTINLSLNSNQIFVINLGTDETITIDTSQMEAYQDGVLKNRSVTGNYNNFALNIGLNEITWSGNITKMTFSNYSRWI